jgi:protein-tyrosine-phosphatase
VRSAAVFNKSKKLHSKAVVALLAEGFNEAQIASYRPMYKRKDINLFEEADIIIGMTRFHKFLTPTKYKSKFTTLSQVALKKYIPIPDPFLASNQKSYDQIMFQIKDYLKKYATCLLESFTDQEKQN